MTTVIIGSHETKLALSCAERGRGGIPTIILAAIDGPGLAASVAAYDDRYGALAVFFEDLAASWRGWDGDRAFYSLEGEFELVARHDGHVRLAVSLRRVDGPGVWTVQTQITVDPGEDLARAAHGVGALVQQP